MITTIPYGSPKTVHSSGTPDSNGSACTFIVTVADHGEPGMKDEFGITVTGDLRESQWERVTSEGNIQFHIQQAKQHFGMRHQTIFRHLLWNDFRPDQ